MIMLYLCVLQQAVPQSFTQSQAATAAAQSAAAGPAQCFRPGASQGQQQAAALYWTQSAWQAAQRDGQQKPEQEQHARQ
jgi:hypothetical protein